MIAKRKLRELYWEEGLTLNQIAKKYGCSCTTIKNWMKKQNIRRRTNPEAQRKIKVAKEELKKLYWRDNLSTNQIAKRLNCSDRGLCQLMDRHGILRRSRSEGIKLNPPIKKGSKRVGFKHPFKGRKHPNRNKFIFNGLNEDLAYILGVRFGDGSIRYTQRSGRFTLKVKDREFIEEVSNRFYKLNISYTKGIRKKQNPNHADLYRISVSSKEFYNWLKNININWLRENLTTWKLQKAFIRGFYDSEGSLYKRKDRRNTYRLSFYNTDMELMDLLTLWLKRQDYNFHSHIRPGKERKKPICMLYICKGNEIKRFCQEIGSSIPRKVIF